MRNTFVAVAAVALLVASAGPALANHDGADVYEYQEGTGETDPDCSGGAEESAVTIDTTPAPGPIGFKQDIPLNFNFDGDEEKDLVFCSGEHWDGQDPNTRDSSGDTRVDEDRENEEGDEKDLFLYVNPLGDCSGYDDTEASDQGCPGGTEKPHLEDGILLDVRATATADYEDDKAVTTYHNSEHWGLGRMATSVHVNHTERDGWIAIFLEDHSDQIFDDDGVLGDVGAGDPLSGPDYDGDGENEQFDGNYLTIPFDFFFAGSVGEGDCEQSAYQDENTACPRDNSGITLDFGYGWLPLAHLDTPEGESPSPLP